MLIERISEQKISVGLEKAETALIARIGHDQISHPCYVPNERRNLRFASCASNRPVCDVGVRLHGLARTTDV